MTEWIRAYLLGITAAALLAAAADSLLPAGPVRKIGKLIGGLILLLAVVRPLLTIRPEHLSRNLTAYRAQSGAYGTALQQANDRLLKTIIEEKTGAYIEEKADALGIECRAIVGCKTGEGEYPYPYEAEIIGNLTQEEWRILSALIERDLAIPQSRSRLHTEDSKR